MSSGLRARIAATLGGSPKMPREKGEELAQVPPIGLDGLGREAPLLGEGREPLHRLLAGVGRAGDDEIEGGSGVAARHGLSGRGSDSTVPAPEGAPDLDRAPFCATADSFAVSVNRKANGSRRRRPDPARPGHGLFLRGPGRPRVERGRRRAGAARHARDGGRRLEPARGVGRQLQARHGPHRSAAAVARDAQVPRLDRLVHAGAEGLGARDGPEGCRTRPGREPRASACGSSGRRRSA